MKELISSINEAYKNPENQSITMKSHRLFLNHTFLLPTKKNSTNKTEPEALFFQENDNYFLPLFSSEAHLTSWANNSLNEMEWLNILGKDVVLGTADNAYLCLDIGQAHYKEYAPSEITRLKQVVLKLEKIAKSTAAK